MMAMSPRDQSLVDVAANVRVMIVDDLSSFRRVARAVIDATPGFETVGDAASGGEALTNCDQLRPDLVLLDVRMPGMDGIEAARRLHRSHPDTVIVLISLEELQNTPHTVTACGAAAFVRKRDFGPTMLRSLWDLHGPSTRGSV
jgi:DNA-binding NarL/FixJ family response regulator